VVSQYRLGSGEVNREVSGEVPSWYIVWWGKLFSSYYIPGMVGEEEGTLRVVGEEEGTLRVVGEEEGTLRVVGEEEGYPVIY